MNNFKKAIIGVLVAVVALLGGSAVIDSNLGGGELITIANSKAVTSATQANVLLEANSSRTYARITNTSDTILYITLGATTTAEYIKGIALNKVSEAGNYFEITDANIWYGVVSVSTSTAGKTLSIIEAY